MPFYLTLYSRFECLESRLEWMVLGVAGKGVGVNGEGGGRQPASAHPCVVCPIIACRGLVYKQGTVTLPLIAIRTIARYEHFTLLYPINATNTSLRKSDENVETFHLPFYIVKAEFICIQSDFLE